MYQLFLTWLYGLRVLYDCIFSRQIGNNCWLWSSYRDLVMSNMSVWYIVLAQNQKHIIIKLILLRSILDDRWYYSLWRNRRYSGLTIYAYCILLQTGWASLWIFLVCCNKGIESTTASEPWTQDIPPYRYPLVFGNLKTSNFYSKYLPNFRWLSVVKGFDTVAGNTTTDLGDLAILKGLISSTVTEALEPFVSVVITKNISKTWTE